MDKCYSFNEEDFDGDLESVVHQIDDYEVGKIVTAFEGDAVWEAAIDSLIRVGDIIEMVQERAYDHAGEVAEDYLKNVSVEAKNELHALLVGWFEKHKYNPNFYTVKNIRPIRVRLLEDGECEIVKDATHDQ